MSKTVKVVTEYLTREGWDALKPGDKIWDVEQDELVFVGNAFTNPDEKVFDAEGYRVQYPGLTFREHRFLVNDPSGDPK